MVETIASAVRRRRSRVILPWAAFAVMFLAIAMTANRGLEMTDEAFYIFGITDPAIFKANIHPFGAVFHLVWQALGHSIIWLRLFGLCLIAGSSATLGFYLDRYYLRVCGRALSFDPVAVAAFFGLAYYADISIMTPSYNLLANSAGCLVLAGALGWRAQDVRLGQAVEWTLTDMPSLLVGFGGCLAFFAKPPFAALAAVAIAVMLAQDGWTGAKRNVLRRLVVTAIACLVPLVLIVVASVDVRAFVASLGEGLRTIRFGNDLASLPLKTLGEVLGMPKALFFTGLVLTAIGVWRIMGGSARLRTAMSAAAAIVLLFDIGYFALHVVLLLNYGNEIWLLMSMPTFCVILAMMAVGLARRDPAAVAWRDLMPVVVLLCLPFAISFGSASHILVQVAISLFAYLLAGAIVADLLLPRRVATSVQTLLIAYAIGLLLWTAHRPYRLPAPIWEQTRPIDFGQAHDRLYVDEKTRLFVQSLRKVAGGERLTAETPIVDLSGTGPGTALLLNGNAPYFPWIVTLYGQGSVDLADAVWRSLDPRSKREAWIVLPVDPVLAHSEPMEAFLRDRGRYRLAARVPNMLHQGGPPVEIWVPNEGARR